MNEPKHASQIQELRSKASRLIHTGRKEQAQSVLEELVHRAPEDIPACLELADLLYQSGRIRASSAPLLTACQHLPRHVPLLLHLVQHLMARGEITATRHCLDFLSQAPSLPAEVLVSLANIRFSLGEVETARQLMERALKAGADRPSDHHTYAMLLQFSGAFDASCQVLDQCLQRWPDFGDAIVPMVNMRRQTTESNDLERIEQQLQSMPARNPDHGARFNRAEFEYARFRVLDQLERYDDAWNALQRCNKLMSELNPYDAQAEEATVDQLLRARDILDRSDAPAAEPDGPMPIFIVGLPRSGTSLLDRMLSSHSEVASAGELIEFWRQLHWVADERPDRTRSLSRILSKAADLDFSEVGARYLEHTRWRAPGRRYFVDKLPANIMMVAFIRLALPDAPILHMVREPMDVCFSNYKAFFGNDSSPHSYDLQSMAHFHRMYRRICDHWRTHLPHAMLDVPYASLVGETETTMQGILAHCGLGIEAPCLHPERNPSPIATPSSTQVREPIHSRSIGEWKHYATHLEPLRKALG